MDQIRSLLRQAETLPEDESSVSSAEREFKTERSAAKFFLDLKPSLLNLRNWNENSGLSVYEHFDRGGRKTADDRPIEEGDFVRITLRGSGKSDWVRVEKILSGADEMIVTVRPSYDPTDDPPRRGETSHFFHAGAVNNFCAYHEGKNVGMYVIGLNEKPNSDATSGAIETARNTLVANLGYYLGVQKAEWTKFCESFLNASERAGE
jgi:hypothetical protein